MLRLYPTDSHLSGYFHTFVSAGRNPHAGFLENTVFQSVGSFLGRRERAALAHFHTLGYRSKPGMGDWLIDPDEQNKTNDV